MKRIARYFAMLLGCALLNQSASAQQPTSQLYGPTADHPWNQLHATLFIRTAGDGKQYGHDTVDPLLWGQSRYLLEPAVIQRAVSILDQIISQDAEKLMDDPLKRAVLQHDLWTVFDWCAAGDNARNAATKDLQARLGKAIKTLALKPDQIAKLPDTYAAAVASKEFAEAFDPNHSDAAFLPADLLLKSGSWISLGTGTAPAAPTYTAAHGGRSVFTVLIKLPGGRVASNAYVQRLNAHTTPYARTTVTTADGTARSEVVLNPNLPALPAGTQFAVIRQMVLIDANGTARVSPITEEVRFRVSQPAQIFQSFALRREKLFKNQAGGFRASAKEDRDFVQSSFDPAASDPLDSPQPMTQNVLENCASCHKVSGLGSFLSFNRPYTPATPRPLVLSDRSDWEGMGRWTITSMTYESPQWLALKRLWIAEK